MLNLHHGLQNKYSPLTQDASARKVLLTSLSKGPPSACFIALTVPSEHGGWNPSVPSPVFYTVHLAAVVAVWCQWVVI